MADDLVTQLARSLNLPQDAARHTLDHLVTTLREQLDAEGEARVPGLGTFRTGDEGLIFHPDDGLARAVNHRYAGLRPIAAGFSMRRRQEVPEEEDPFADATTDLSEDDHEETAPPDAVFQPIGSFIEESAQDDEPGSTDEPFEDAGAETPTLTASTPAEPDVPEPAPDTAAEDEALEEEVRDEEPLDAQAADAEEDEAVGEDEADVTDEDAPFAASWVSMTDEEEEAHVLGPLPPDETEDAEFDVIHDEGELDIEEEPIEEQEAEDEDATADVGATASLLADQDAEQPDVEEDVEIEADASTTETSEAERAPAAAELSEFEDVEPAPVTEPDVEPEAEPDIQPVAVSPAVAADRPPAEQESSRSNAGRVVVGIVLLLCVAGIVWFLNRESPTPVAGEQPVPADTNAVAAAPLSTDDAPADTAALPVDEAPAEPTPPADPLLGDAGIDPAGGGFTWVVASEIDQAAAERRVAQYREQGLRAGVVAQEAAGRTRYRVSLGQFDSIADAEARRADLPSDVPSDSWILRLES